MLLKEIKTNNIVYDIGIFLNNEGKYQFVNITKEKICPCCFDSEQAAFSDLYKYIKAGKIKQIICD